MAKLVHVDPGNLGKSVALGRENSIGRGAANSIVVPDASVLDRHATLSLSEGRYRLEMAGASASVSVNGQPVTGHILKHGDLISIGAVSFLFSEDRPETVPSPETTKPTTTRVLSRSTSLATPEAVVAALRKGERVAERLETLYRVANAVGSAQDLSELLDQLATHTFSAFGSDRCFVLLHDAGGGVEARRERASKSVQIQGTGGIPQAILKEALEKMEAVLIESPLDDPKYDSSRSIRELKIQSALCAPVVRDGRGLGFIEVDTVTTGRSYTSEDLNLLNAIAAQAAIAIENLRKREEEAALGRLLMRLGEGSRVLSSSLSREFIVRESVERAGQIFECTKVSVLLLDEAGQLGVAASNTVDPALWPEILIRPGDGIAGRCLREGRALGPREAIPAPGRTYETSAFVVAPIVSRGEGLRSEAKGVGVLCVADKRSKGQFGLRDQELVSIFAGQIGIALTNARLFQRATVDGLTRLFTRQYFNVQLEEEVRTRLDPARPLSLLMCDLDHFKSKNDTYGHAAGDVILSEAGGIVRTRVPSEAFPARYGGEEFVVILPGLPLAEATRAGEEIRRSVEAHAFQAAGQTLKCTVSIGAAQLEAGDTPEKLIRRADTALYTAKRSGRNRVESLQGGA